METDECLETFSKLTISIKFDVGCNKWSNKPAETHFLNRTYNAKLARRALWDYFSPSGRHTSCHTIFLPITWRIESFPRIELLPPWCSLKTHLWPQVPWRPRLGPSLFARRIRMLHCHCTAHAWQWVLHLLAHDICIRFLESPRLYATLYLVSAHLWSNVKVIR